MHTGVLRYRIRVARAVICLFSADAPDANIVYHLLACKPAGQCVTHRILAQFVSVDFGKWLKQFFREGCTMNSFKHSMRDRLKAVLSPVDIGDQIGRWTLDGVGQGYGLLYSIEVLQKWMSKTL